jgi:MATE family multidrug resistance protein
MNSGGLMVAMRLARLGAPIAVGRLGVVGMGLVDTIVVGQLAPRELAHQALGWTINGPALIGGVSLLLGVQVLAARAIGAGDPAAAGVFWRRGLVIALTAGAAVCVLVWTAAAPLLLALGVEPELARRGAAVAAVLALSIPLHLLFMASQKFLEALERPIPGAVAMWIANGLNLALDLALVPGGGAIGSAWATVLSRLFLAVVMAGFILRAPSLRPFRSGARAGAVAGYRAMLAIGLAAAVSGLVEAAGFASMGVIATRSGGFSLVLSACR